MPSVDVGVMSQIRDRRHDFGLPESFELLDRERELLGHGRTHPFLARGAERQPRDSADRAQSTFAFRFGRASCLRAIEGSQHAPSRSTPHELQQPAHFVLAGSGHETGVGGCRAHRECQRPGVTTVGGIEIGVVVTIGPLDEHRARHPERRIDPQRMVAAARVRHIGESRQ